MEPTDVSNPRYYHKVVDCQWACPAHTNVPAYIRLIAQGRYTESYLLNREQARRRGEYEPMSFAAVADGGKHETAGIFAALPPTFRRGARSGARPRPDG
ncbi:MAG: hypothetical protein ACKOTB_01115 [Planctomycetia bacterium]